ncbi:chitinase [Ceratobasidium sp. AG-Ba]|nr:chitinase [Ceratobasidium sp. AG-Ba]
MRPLAPLVLLGLSASPSLGRPMDPPDDEPIPILVLPPGALKHETIDRVPQPSNALIIPLFNSEFITPTILATTLTLSEPAATETIHIVETKTVTVVFQATQGASLPPPSPSASDHHDNENKPVMATYYPDWTADEFPPEKVDFNRFAWIDFAFAVPDASRRLTFTSADSEDSLRRLVSAAHAHGSKVKLSVGGWTGSAYFSDAVSSDSKRHEFVKNIVAMYHTFSLDGIDIDWEYPGTQGAGSNKVSHQDTPHFLSFLQLLRAQLPPSAKITAATQVTPFIGPDGQPLKDVSAFAKVLDWILIMNYDVWGASSTPGPNAPLRDGCHNSTQPDASASASVAAWTKAGLPANQITLGVPSYGYVQTSSASRLVQRRRSLWSREAGDEEGFDTSSTQSTAVRVKGEGEGDDSGQIQFKQLVSEGALKLDHDGDYVGAGGFNRMWDVCSSTPYLVSKAMRQVVTYDDPQSLGMKAAFAQGAGLKGVNMFDVHGDTEDWILTDAIRAGLGLE